MATYTLTSSIPSVDKIQTGDILNCPYSGTYKAVTLPPGTYQLECWGAQGGSVVGLGGKGGYSIGIYVIKQQTTLYLYVGGCPTTYIGGYNGGGNASRSGGAAGGGATHIALLNGLLKTLSTNKDKIILVAGAGGGDHSNNYTGGYGGGTSGGQGESMGSNGQYAGSPGTQTNGGVGNNAHKYTDGGFGYGGQGYTTQSSTSDSYTIAGGGAGLYGGSGGYYAYASGCGGSGYVNTSLLTSASTKAGNVSFKDYSGSIVTGHSGNGAIKITVLNVTISTMNIRIKKNNSLYSISKGQIKINNIWNDVNSAYIKVNGTWKQT